MTWQPERQYPYEPSQNQWEAPPPQVPPPFPPNPVYQPPSTNGLPFNYPIPVFNPRNLPYVRGETKQPGPANNQIVYIGLIIAAALAGVIMLFFWATDYLNDSELNQKGYPGKALISDRTYSTGRYGGKSFQITYTFSVSYGNNGSPQMYTNQQWVSEEFYNTHGNGTVIPIRFLVANPGISEIVGQLRTDILPKLILAFFALLFAGTFTWIIVSDNDLNKLLAEKGQPILGTIEDVRIVRGRRFTKNLIVEYSFVTPSGKAIYKKYTTLYKDYHKNLDFGSDMPVGIVYADDKHFKLV